MDNLVLRSVFLPGFYLFHPADDSSQDLSLKPTQVADCASRGYSESIPKSLHTDRARENLMNQQLDRRPQYPQSLLLLLLRRRTLITTYITSEKSAKTI